MRTYEEEALRALSEAEGLLTMHYIHGANDKLIELDIQKAKVWAAIAIAYSNLGKGYPNASV